MYVEKKHFCLFWKSQGVTFIEAFEELYFNFENVEKCISDKPVKIFNEYEYKPKKNKLN